MKVVTQHDLDLMHAKNCASDACDGLRRMLEVEVRWRRLKYVALSAGFLESRLSAVKAGGRVAIQAAERILNAMGYELAIRKKEES